MNFQGIVVVIAIIILIALLSWIGYVLYNSYNNVKFPPVENQCPDSWKASGENCINVKHLGTCHSGQLNTMNFNIPYFKGAQGKCNKAKWAQRCGVSWQGISNSTECTD
tara:strand:- start:1232 stop:1558 length:327 start_codon:yes stop_codon:yes gene_type:complete